MAEDVANDEVRNRYELSFLTRNAEDGGTVASVASRHGAEVSFQSPMNQIRLAYPIRKEVSAYFGFIQFTLLRSEAVKMSEELRRDASVLRFLLIAPPVTQPLQAEKPVAPGVIPAPVAKPASPRSGITTNEALEKRLEEILK